MSAIFNNQTIFNNQIEPVAQIRLSSLLITSVLSHWLTTKLLLFRFISVKPTHPSSH